MTIFKKADLLTAAWAVYEKKGKPAVQEIASRFVLSGARVSLNNIPENKIDDVILALQACLGNRVMGYAYNSSVPAARPHVTMGDAASPYEQMAKELEGVEYSSAPRAIGIDPAMTSPYGEVKLTQVSLNSFGGAPEDVRVSWRDINDRETAQLAVKELREKFDLLDDEATMRLLLDRMEERHGEEFNHFFEATIRQIMKSSGMSELRISTSAVLHTLASDPAPLVVRELPGFLVYTLAEDAEDGTVV